MIKTAQFGEGNFLRSFADLYFDTLNKEGGDHSVDIIKPIPSGSLDSFKKQDNKYNVILRGFEKGQASEKVYSVSVINSVISPFEDIGAYYDLARDPELKIVVSNTTEAGICFNESDSFHDFEGITFPAKLTKFLYERFKAGLGGLYMLPVELIDNNADALYGAVDSYIRLWGLPEEFKSYNDKENFYCNTLVDRIVSGYPRDPETREKMTSLIGHEDALMSIAEPFGLWAIENKGDIAKYIPQGRHNIDVVLTDDIGYYKKRKVRVLNGSHTNLVPAGLALGAKTVYDCMTDKRLYSFFENTLDEIIPFVSDDIGATRAFADDVKERFFSPFLNHQLMSIALNSISKWRARNLPSFRDYYSKNGVIPHSMTVGFSYLVFLYKNRYDELTDDRAYLDYFKNGGDIKGFMANTDIWGEDLTEYNGFFEAVKGNVDRIERGEILI